MRAEKRREKIINLLKNKESLNAIKLASILNISTAILYKDLGILEKQKYMKTYYEGIKLLNEEKIEHVFFRRLK